MKYRVLGAVGGVVLLALALGGEFLWRHPGGRGKPAKPGAEALSYDVTFGGASVGSLRMVFDIGGTAPKLEARGTASTIVFNGSFTMETDLDASLSPIEWRYLHESDGERLVFEANAALFQKLKHCKGCEDPKHFVNGEHCKGCDNIAHKVWRGHRRISPIAPDLLTAVYRLRASKPFRKQTTKFLWADQLWQADLNYQADETLTIQGDRIPAERFNAVLEPLNSAAQEVADGWKGYVDLADCLTICFSKDTHIPVKLRLKGRFLTDIQIDITLKKEPEVKPARRP